MPNQNIDADTSNRTRLWMMIPLAIFGGLVGIFAVQLLSGRDAGELPSALIGKPAPSFDLPALPGLERGGEPVPALASTALKGDLRLVNIFASWCAPCRAEHPVLMALAERYEVDIVGINYKDRDPNALKFLNELGNPYSRVGADHPGRTAIEFGFYGIPETFLVDAEGIVRHKIVGPIDAKKFEGLQAKIAELKGG